ncbi:hypothetical protein MJO28_002677 [Puccinia striiformis f. sp. tritici]|uniref:Uncharacterized protein n=5 Tax=Puccinia striiformis TaxID=27350 RepID=A0A0L0V036_9BASI|nr:hypothetical protein Pst134EB_006437 [Puccinia striiformis f. sp. tritici]KAI9619149.1 hypothetical protein H4Q26_011829 [Puccinia striiformis f. sp. tritici PST-130]KNE92531.1 hypothetical protein PSTG_14041 [Puccinia striiformis f. sp. tritici PST-78]POW20799.1 hypothetical protein PSHT_03084 [Puccinia striiformis]KAI7958886.1 hypothetical protein MJO28_002677 [Puccinia striiformis f. sp. tritici]
MHIQYPPVFIICPPSHRSIHLQLLRVVIISKLSMSTVSRALISTIAIVTGGFVVGQYLQPDTRTSSIPELPTSETDDTDDGSFSESDLARLPLSELNRHLQNLNALKRNVEAERSIILNKLVEVDRRIQLAKRTSSSSSTTSSTP